MRKSAALRFENLSKALQIAGFTKNEYEIRVCNKWSDEIQCMVAVHADADVDDLIVTRVGRGMIKATCRKLKERYGEIP